VNKSVIIYYRNVHKVQNLQTNKEVQKWWKANTQNKDREIVQCTAYSLNKSCNFVSIKWIGT